jgi:hypothetical protein
MSGYSWFTLNGMQATRRAQAADAYYPKTGNNMDRTFSVFAQPGGTLTGLV